MPDDPSGDEGAAPGPAGKPVEAPSSIVLVVEDDPDVRGLLERLVTGAGYRVLSAGTGAEALAVIGTDGAVVDLILTDIGLGDMHGAELARRAQELRPGVPVVYSSGHVRAAASLEGTPPGDAFLLKPYRAEDLKRVLGQVLAR